MTAGCAGEFLIPKPAEVDPGDLTNEEARLSPGVRINFHYKDFWSLTDPNAYACAGDIKSYYKPFSLDDDGRPEAFDLDELGNGVTHRPPFIRNVAVDVTDSNVDVDANQAYSCSLGQSNGPPISNCATFDYGALAGVSTTMSGSLMIIGGVHGKNFASIPTLTSGTTQGRTVSCGPLIEPSLLTGGTEEEQLNVCPAESYAVGIETLPPTAAGDENLAPGISSSDVPISSWSKLEHSGGPRGIAGAAMAYNPNAGKLMVVGGSAPIGAAAPTGPAAPSHRTYVFDVKSQTWSSSAASSLPATADISMLPFVYYYDHDGDPLTAPIEQNLQISRVSGARAYHGYVSVPRLAFVELPTATTAGTFAASQIDYTDRIVILGGVVGTDQSGAPIHSTSVHKFNPTFGPEWIHVTSLSDGASGIVQWIEPHPSQPLSLPADDDPATNDGDWEVLFGQIVDDNADGIIDAGDRTNNWLPAFDFATAAITGSGTGGSFVTIGGFPGWASTEAGASDDATGYAFDGPMRFLYRSDPSSPKQFLVLPSFGLEDLFDDETPADRFQGRRLDPIEPNMDSVVESAEQDPADYFEQAPALGGGIALPGFDLANREVVYFGGITCKNYRAYGGTCTADLDPDGSGGSGTDGNIPLTRAWNLSATSTSLDLNGANQITTLSGTEPRRAGMAAARGIDTSDNVIMVAWGGTASPGSAGDAGATANLNRIYVLTNPGGGGTYTWLNLNPTGSYPTAKVNAAMVYSHVTGKFYVFGGYDPGTGLNSQETWALTIDGNCNSGSCTATWTQLTGDGLTCAPGCTAGPAARRGHRMTEVNYNHADGTDEYTSCPAGAPCSFGIFMEGGTSNDAAVFGDRWMFDPTANGGKGHWQRVNDFPPRKLAAMASFSYKAPGTQVPTRRMLVFGGETGLHSPNDGIDGNYYLAPALGDTIMYDLDSNQWGRAKLYGKGVHVANSDFSGIYDGLPEVEKRQIFRANSGSDNGATYHNELTRLAPPPLAGQMMITRTRKGAVTDPDSRALNVQEIYMFGGRKKDGSYAGLQEVWKFCPGSTGEDYSSAYDGTCDSNDPELNPASPSPTTAFAGRWLKKVVYNTGATDVDVDGNGIEDVNSLRFSSFMGAAGYDSRRDRIVVFGGVRASTGTEKVTEARDVLSASGEIYEYTFPTRTLRPQISVPAAADQPDYQGYWTKIPVCAGSETPDGRYGHSLHYDSLHDQILLFGGYALDGGALTQAWTVDGSDIGYDIPELWKGKRKDDLDDPSNDCYEWTRIEAFANEFSSTDPDYPLLGMGHMATAFIAGEGFNSGYYSMFDASCDRAGPISTDDFSINKLLAGGAYIDIDRSQLGSNEDLLLHLTFIPLGPDNLKPTGVRFDASEAASFRVHLEKTGFSENQLQAVQQPRHILFHDAEAFPKTVHTLSVLAPPTGSIRQEQILLPISMDRGIDRIRIERYSGSGILIDASVFRMGQK